MKNKLLFLGIKIPLVCYYLVIFHLFLFFYLDLDKECWNVLQVTAWIPLLNATKENGMSYFVIFIIIIKIKIISKGCLQMLSGGHRSGTVCQHNCCAGGTWYIELPVTEMEKTLNTPVNEKTVVTCEVPFGSVLLFNNLIPHRSLENSSEKIRWSLDLRW